MAGLVDVCQSSDSDPEVLTSLWNNPAFQELQATLIPECKSVCIPYSLITEGRGGDDMIRSEASRYEAPVDLVVEDATLQAEFRQLAPMQDARVGELERFYSIQGAAIVTQRTDAVTRLQLHELTPEQFNADLNCINEYYDKQQEHLTLRISKSLQLLKSTLPNNIQPPGGQTRKQKSRLLNPKAVEIMSSWYFAHEKNPYPTEEEKRDMAEQGNISLAQVKAWFANKRNRTLNTKPKRQRAQFQRQVYKACDVYKETSNGDLDRKGFLTMINDLSGLVTIRTMPGANVESAFSSLANLAVMT